MKIVSAGYLDGYRRLKDKSVSLKIVTSEKSPQEIMEIDTMLDSFGYFIFKAEEELTKSEINELDNLTTDIYDKAKTQSQRMRAVLFLNWMNEDEGHKDFKTFYKEKTEKIIEFYKSKLPENE